MMFDEFNSLIGLSAKAANANDNPFRAQLFYSTKPFFYELGLPREVVDTMLAQQYQLQQASYREQYPNANTYILFYHQQAVGKVMLDISEHRVHLIDLIVIHSMRGQGFGSAILAFIKQRRQYVIYPLVYPWRRKMRELRSFIYNMDLSLKVVLTPTS